MQFLVWKRNFISSKLNVIKFKNFWEPRLLKHGFQEINKVKNKIQTSDNAAYTDGLYLNSGSWSIRR